MEINNAQPATGKPRSKTPLLLIIILIIVIGAVAWILFLGPALSDQTNEPQQENITVEDVLPNDSNQNSGQVLSSSINLDKLAITVNDQKIDKDMVELIVSQISQDATAQGADISDNLVKQNIVDQASLVLVNTQLILQEAQKSSTEVTSAEVDEAFTNRIGFYESEEAFEADLKNLGLSRSELRKQVEIEVTVQKFMTNMIANQNFTATEEEVSARYDQLVANSPAEAEIPPLSEELQAQISQQLLIEKEQVFVDNYITTLRNNASIDISS